MAECHNCQKKNHFGKMCRTAGLKQSRTPNKEVREIIADSNDDFLIEMLNIFEAWAVNKNKALAIVNILEEKLRMKLDTSTEVNIMPDQVYQKLVTNENVSKDAEIKTNTKLTGYGGTEIPVTRRCTLLCLYKEQEIETEFYVVETNNRAVLSLETCKELNLIKVMHSLMSSSKVSDCSTEQIKENFRDFSWSWKTRLVLSYGNGSTSSSYWVSP